MNTARRGVNNSHCGLEATGCPLHTNVEICKNYARTIEKFLKDLLDIKQSVCGFGVGGLGVCKLGICRFGFCGIGVCGYERHLRPPRLKVAPHGKTTQND
ncbi:hypothetical protein NQ318_004898 [Aromia moschata]|uniref:Uncharacterized protein n=1 Tax=Aromia moschata TaxID=1265417 RepID=A0AAV8YZY1_9CUCU|nr:hypothetical protein NQ318_004898 [Aromia moschata]